MKYLKIFEVYNPQKPSKEDGLNDFMPSEDELKNLINTRLLTNDFRIACQIRGLPQLVSDKLVSDKFDIDKNKTLAVLSNLQSVFSFDKTREGFQELKNKIGNQNIDDIIDEITHRKNAPEEDIDINKKHTVTTSLTFDVLVRKSTMAPPKGQRFDFYQFKVEGKFSAFYDDFQTFELPFEKELNLMEEDETSKNDMNYLIIDVLVKLNINTIHELNNH